jgi:hypothetical protein
MPSTLWVEGLDISSSAGDVALTLQTTVGCAVALNLTVLKVEFKEDPTQSYGYDELDTASPKSPEPYDYVSIEKGGETTKVKVTVEPSGFSGSVFFVPNGSGVLDATAPVTPASVGGGTHVLTLKSGVFPDDHHSCVLEARVGAVGGSVCEKLGVEAYKEHLISEISYYRVHDNSSPGTALPASPDPTLAELKSFINGVWQQGVLRVDTVAGDRNKDCAYDINSNAKMDFYFTGPFAANPELSVLDTCLGGPQRVAYLKAVRVNYGLDADAVAGDNFIKLQSTYALSYICPGYTIRVGPATGAGNTYTVADPTFSGGNQLNLTSALGEDHPKATHHVYFEVAGLSGDPLLVTNAGGELKETICHELLHENNVGDLEDIEANDNIMHYTGPIIDTLLRKRKLTDHYTSGPCGTGTKGTDEQWDQIPR